MTTSHHIPGRMATGQLVESNMRRHAQDIAATVVLIAVVVALAFGVAWLVPFELIAPRPQ